MDEITPVKTRFRMEQWTQLIQERQSSGMSVKAWCQQNQIKETSYYYWLKRIRQQACSVEITSVESEPDQKVTFAKIPLAVNEPGHCPAAVIHFTTARVEIMNGATPETVKSVLEAIRSLC